jgi:3-mercaptopyruvate sulfurtransferase SseA
MLRPTSPAAWLLVRSQLQELGVKLISQQELLFAQEAGVPVIDIRPPPEWEAGHIEGSVNVPLYRLITGALTNSARLCFLFT